MAYNNTAGMANSRTGVRSLSNGTATLTKTKKVRYGATSDQIFSISEAISASETNEVIPSIVSVKNTGLVPVMGIAGYEDFTADGTSANGCLFIRSHCSRTLNALPSLVSG